MMKALLELSVLCLQNGIVLPFCLPRASLTLPISASSIVYIFLFFCDIVSFVNCRDSGGEL